MRKRKAVLKNLNPEQETFLIKRLEEEWSAAERAAKQHELVEQAKRAGLTTAKILLGSLLVVGVVTVALVAPKAFAVFAPERGRHRFLKTGSLPKELARGSSRSYWRYEKTGENRYRVYLTRRGRKMALRNAIREFKLRRADRWDGLYRVVMFDVSRRHNTARDGFRRRLTEIGMRRLQESVFVFPYPCEEEVRFCASLFNISENIHLIEGKFPSDVDLHLRKVFEL